MKRILLGAVLVIALGASGQEPKTTLTGVTNNVQISPVVISSREDCLHKSGDVAACQLWFDVQGVLVAAQSTEQRIAALEKRVAELERNRAIPGVTCPEPMDLIVNGVRVHCGVDKPDASVKP